MHEKGNRYRMQMSHQSELDEKKKPLIDQSNGGREFSHFSRLEPTLPPFLAVDCKNG